MSEHFKKLVQQIKKMAGPFVDGPGGSAPASVPGSLPNFNKVPSSKVGPKPGIVPSKPTATDPETAKSVRWMQQAIQSLNDAVNGNPEFTDYLFKAYKLSPKTFSRLKYKIDMDGAWGRETNNFLFDAGWIAKGILQAVNDFKMVAPNSKSAFREEDFDQMRKLQPTSKNPQQDEPEGLAEKAEAFTKILDKLTYFYQTYSKHVIQSDLFKELSNKEKVILNVGLTPPEKFKNYLSDPKFLEQSVLSNVNIPGPQNKPVQVKDLKLSWLVNPRYFQGFLTQYLGYSEEESQNKDVQNTVLNDILKQVSATWKLSSIQG